MLLKRFVELLEMSPPKRLSNLCFSRRCLYLLFFSVNFVCPCCVNITVAVLNEYSEKLDFPSQINRTAGIIDKALNKSREILQEVANVNFIIYNLNYPACTSLHWGALTARLFFYDHIHAIIGPGNYFLSSFLLGNLFIACSFKHYKIDFFSLAPC